MSGTNCAKCGRFVGPRAIAKEWGYIDSSGEQNDGIDVFCNKKCFEGLDSQSKMIYAGSS